VHRVASNYYYLQYPTFSATVSDKINFAKRYKLASMAWTAEQRIFYGDLEVLIGVGS